ncbi:MAG TPA: putative 2OG-Fe(II) oxygenase [Magnetospirillum sp.]|nr:putative 2OG-Fe(II) oxygenase [Magnetospirillum sp.]
MAANSSFPSTAQASPTQLCWRSMPAAANLFPPAVRIAACRDAMARGGANAEIRQTLLAALLDVERFEEAADLVRQEQSPPGRDPEWDIRAIRALRAVGRSAEALAVADGARDCGAEHPSLAYERVMALMELGRDRDAGDHILDFLKRPGARVLNPRMSALLVRLRGADFMLDTLNEYPARFSPADREHNRICCLLSLGRDAEADSLMAVDRLLARVDMAPALDTDVTTFNADLASEIRALPSLVNNPRYRSTRQGLQTRFIWDGKNKHIHALLRHIKCAVEAYAADAVRREIPYLNAPSPVYLQPWAVSLARGGHQKPHIHPSGWISGCYYVTTPDVDAAAGALCIPTAPPKVTSVPWQPHTIVPKAGQLMLFPSYFWHHTKPHGSDEERICIAFDVKPAR